jgi:hypothetical protein
MVSLHGLYSCFHTQCTLDSNFMKINYINRMEIFETPVSVVHSHLNVNHTSSEKNTSSYVILCPGLKLSFIIFPLFHTLFLYVVLLTENLSVNFWWHSFCILHKSIPYEHCFFNWLYYLRTLIPHSFQLPGSFSNSEHVGSLPWVVCDHVYLHSWTQ